MSEDREYTVEEILADVKCRAENNEEDELIAQLFKGSEFDGFAGDVEKDSGSSVFSDIEAQGEDGEQSDAGNITAFDEAPMYNDVGFDIFEDYAVAEAETPDYEEIESETEEADYEEVTTETEEADCEEISAETEEADYEEVTVETEEADYEEIATETAETDSEEVTDSESQKSENEDILQTVLSDIKDIFTKSESDCAETAVTADIDTAEDFDIFSDGEENNNVAEEFDIFADSDKSDNVAEEFDIFGDSDEDDDVTVYEKGKDDFSFEKMYEEKKEQNESASKPSGQTSKTKVFKKEKIEAASAGNNVGEDEAVEAESELEKEFNEKRKEKIHKFRLFAESLEGDEYGDEPEQGVSVTEAVKPKKGEDIFAAIENTDKPKKENSKRRENRKKRESKVYDKIDVGRVKLNLTNDARSIKLRMTAMLVSFILCLIFGVMKTAFVNGKLAFLSPLMGENPVIAYAVELLLGLPALFISLKAFIGAMRRSEKPTLCSEAVTALVMLFNTVHNAVLVIARPEMDKGVMFFNTAACFIALFGLYGEKRQNIMISRNLKTIVRNDTILGIFALESESEKLASGISKAKEPTVLCAGEVEIPNSFLDSSLTKDKENTFFNFAVPASFVLSVVCGIIAYVSYGSVTAFSSAALSALLVCAPVFISPVLVSLIARTNESLNRTGCEILGYEDVENVDDTDAIVIDTADIFTGSISHFHLISRSVKIDTLHAFEIACSVIYSSGGVLRGEVAEFIKEQKLVLPKVEDMKYEEKLGISCWVEDKCVLLGNEKMMKEHNIHIPPEYSGKKYEKEGSKVFYLAVDTWATAVFCADYYIGRQAKKQLTDLYKTGVILMLMTTDPHIDEQFVANTLGVSASSIKTVSPVGAKQIRESISATTKQKRTGLIFRKSVIGFLKVINAAFRLYDVQSLAMLIQIVSMVFAVVVSGVLSVAATGYLPGVIFIIAYHSVWTALAHFVTNKNKK